MSKSTTPKQIARVNSIRDIFHRIGKIVEPEFSEDEVQMVFLNEGYFSLLGYSDIGLNLKSEVSIGNRRADYVTTGQRFESDRPETTVYEFKNPDEKLFSHKKQLHDCVNAINASYGVLTNGQQFALYELSHSGINHVVSFNIQEATDKEASVILRKLSSLSVEEQELRTMARATAEAVADELPRKLWAHPGFSGPVTETFAKYHAEFLFDELSTRR